MWWEKEYYIDIQHNAYSHSPCTGQDPHDVDPRLAGARGGGVVEGLEVEHQPGPPQLAVQERADLVIINMNKR